LSIDFDSVRFNNDEDKLNWETLENIKWNEFLG
jgi:hypothetical protein